jgi:hypothetical protein
MRIGTEFFLDCEVPDGSVNMVCGTGLKLRDLTHSVVTECQPNAETNNGYNNCVCKAFADGEECLDVPCSVCGQQELDETFAAEYTCGDSISETCPTSVQRNLQLGTKERELQFGDDTFFDVQMNVSTALLFECTDTEGSLAQECEMCVTIGAETSSISIEHCVTINCVASEQGDNLWEDCTCVATLNGETCTEDPCKVLGSGDLDESFKVDYDCVDLKTGPEGNLYSAEEIPTSGTAGSMRGYAVMILTAAAVGAISF